MLSFIQVTLRWRSSLLHLSVYWHQYFISLVCKLWPFKYSCKSGMTLHDHLKTKNKTLTTARIYCVQLQPVTIRFLLQCIHLATDQQDGILVSFKMPLSFIKCGYIEMRVQKRVFVVKKKSEVKMQNLTMTLTMTRLMHYSNFHWPSQL